MTVSVGTHIGPYEVVEWLGAGGMGVVYRARDPRLGREVALKVVSEQFAADRSRVHRFEEEARAAGQLNHPNLLTVFDFGVHDGSPYLVTELLEGESMHALLEGGALPLAKAIGYARQTCEGLAAAHDKGIVHRDIKPDNLFVTGDGRLKILDFGIAKLTQPGADGDRSTVTSTAADAVVGTASYMSPERWRGRGVDSRSDLFAVGAVLYEMLSGRKAFPGDTSGEVAAAILKESPTELSQLVPDLPPRLSDIVQRCLHKNQIERFQSARDLAFALGSVTDAHASSGVGRPVVAAEARPGSSSRVWAGVAALALCIGAGIGWWVQAQQTPSHQTASPAFEQLTDFPGTELSPSVSPDGNTVIYASDAAGNFDIYSLRVGGRHPMNLTADSTVTDATPVLSPAGTQIAFRSERGGGGIFVMGATGESVRRVSDFGNDPSWSPDGTQLVVSSIHGPTPYERTGTGELSIVAVADGARRPLTTPMDAVQPAWSPLGRHIAFWGVERGTGRRDIWTIAIQPQGVPVRVTNDAAVDWNPVWSADGRHLLFASDRGGVMNLWRIAIDEKTGGPAGEAEPLTLPTAFVTGFSVTQDGRVVFASTDRRTTFLRLDFDAAREAVTGTAVLMESPRIYRYPHWSPDGETIVFSTFGPAENLYLISADGSSYRQVTDDSHRNRGPRWFPDSSRLLFYSTRNGTYQAWSIRPDGSNPQQLTETPASVVRPVLSGSADRIAYRPSLSMRWSIAELRSPGEERVTEMPPAPGGANPAPNSWSRDGTRIALFEDRPGTAEPRMFVYDIAAKQYRPLQVTGSNPSWLPDDRRILFTTRTGVSLIDTVTGRTREVHKLAADLDAQSGGFATSGDGRRMALLVLTEKSDLWMLTLRAAQARN